MRPTRHIQQAVVRPCLLLLGLLVGCEPSTSGGSAGPAATVVPSAPAGAATPAPTLAASTPAAPATAPTAADTFQNPVIRADFADPDVLKVGDTYYAYATNAIGKNIQVARSTDLVQWTMLPDAMPALPMWAKLGGSLVWAPEVIELGAQFVMYYTARDKASNRQCIGVATSAKPEGRFKDTNAAPLVCQADQGGSIDPDPFNDGDTHYLYWKNDGNCCNKPTYLYVQQLTSDGLSLVGAPAPLLRNDALWEGNLVEAPTMVKHDTGYYLFFSANDYGGPKYAVGYAACQSAVGPCQDAPENPILASHMQPPLVVGPGHQSIVQVGDETWIAYHAWEIVSNGRRGDRRFMYIDQLTWQDGKPHVNGPTTNAQPRP